MNIKVKFFEDKFLEAIGAGIYGIYVKNDEREELLYIGESEFVLVRCATHLYEIRKGNGYLGFDNNLINNNRVTLIFRLLFTETDKAKRKQKEKELVKSENPIMQSGISDRVKSIEDMIEGLVNFMED